MKRFFLALAFVSAGCSTPEADPHAPREPAPKLSDVPLPTPALRAAVAGTEAFAEHVADALRGVVLNDGDRVHVWGFESGDPAIREFELGGLGDLTVLDRAIESRAPLGVLGPDGALPPGIERERYDLFVARDATRFGLLSRASEPLGTNVRLVDDRALDVELTTSTGAPVPRTSVRLVFDHGHDRESRLAAARSDEHGHARLPHVGFALAELARTSRADRELRVEVGSPLTPLERRVLAKGLSDAQPTRAIDPLRLTVAPNAAILVRAVPEPVGGWPKSLEVLVHRSPALARAPDVEWRDAQTSPLRGSLSAEGVEFDGLKLGTELTALVRIGADIRITRGRVPDEAGERAELVLHLEELPPAFLARAIDAAGRPLADRELELHRELAGNSFWDRVLPNVVTDQDGRFLLTAVMRGNRERPELDWHLRALVDGVPHEARIPASAWPSADDPRLAGDKTPIVGGDVRFEPVPTLVSGRVVDDAGSPVEDVRVRVAALVPDAASDSLAHRIERLATTDRDGRFAFFGRSSAGELGVRASHGRLRATTAQGAPGATLELVVPRAGAVAGSLRVPSELREAGLRVSVRPLEVQTSFRAEYFESLPLERHSSDEPELVGRFHVATRDDTDSDAPVGDEYAESSSWRELLARSKPQDDSSDAPFVRPFSIDGIASGPALLVVTTANGHELTSLEIEVRPGETSREARFDPLDLAAFVRTVELDVAAESGAELDGLIGLWNCGVGWYPWQHIAFDGSHARIATFEPELEVFVTATGHRHAKLATREASVSLGLTPALQVEFVIHRRDPALPACGELQLIDGGELHPPVGSATPVPFDFGDLDCMRVGLPCAGRYLVRWFASPDPTRTRVVTTEQAGLLVREPSTEPIELSFPEELVLRATRR